MTTNKTCTAYSGYCAPTVEDHLITRAREYVTDKYLDLADVPKFIERLVELHDANERLTARLREIESDKSFDVSDAPTSEPVARRPVRCG